MPQNPPQGTQRIVPYVLYRDAPAAIEFLTGAFGFVERYRIPMGDAIGHAELGLGEDSVVYLATAVDAMGHGTPKESGVRHGLVCVYVDDADAACARAKQAGATIASEPEDQFYGQRTFRAVDPEGHEWNFAQVTAEFDPASVPPS